jgi:hypothetical protein
MQMGLEFDGNRTHVVIDLEKLGAPALGGFIKTHNVSMKLKLNYADFGDVLIFDGKELATSLNSDLKVK